MHCPRCGMDVPRESSFCNHCGSSLLVGIEYPTQELSPQGGQDILSFHPDQSFANRYRIIEEIGRGGMGRVYKAEDQQLNILVAIKMIHPELLTNPRIIARFKKEILLAREISHENVVRIYDIGEFKGIKFITMQYIDGTTLKKLIQDSGSLSVEKSVYIVRQIANGLSVAHQKGIVHRDLKPQNIMITKDDRVFITDFGLAKSIDSQEISLTGSLIGTPEYISPEQAGGQEADPRSDIYTLGLIFYEMVTGKLPFKANSVLGYLQKHLYETPTRPSRYISNISLTLENVILKCLEKEAKNRYQNVQEILSKLEDETIFKRVKISRYWLKRALIMVFISLLLLLGGYGLFKQIKKTSVTLPKGEKHSVAVVYFENQTGDAAMNHWSRAIPDLITTDLSQSRYFRIMSESHLYQVLKDLGQTQSYHYTSAVLKQIASLGKVNYIILGSFTRGGGTYRVNVKIWEPVNAEVVQNIVVEGAGTESLFSIVDQMTKDIKTAFHLTKREMNYDLDREIGEITTRSPEALKYYIEGKGLYLERKDQESIQVLKKAIDVDPDFALAHWRLAINYYQLGSQQDGKDHLEKALNLLHRVSVKEKYLIQGMAASVLKNDNKWAIDNYKKIIELYPDDERATLFLGVMYRNIEDWLEAENWFRKALIYNDSSSVPYVNLMNVLMAQGKYVEARKIILDGNSKKVFPNEALFQRSLCSLFLCQGKYDMAQAAIEKVAGDRETDYQTRRLKGNTMHLLGELAEAEKIYRQLAEMDDIFAFADGKLYGSYLLILQGKYKESQQELISSLKKIAQSDQKDLADDIMLYLAYIGLRLNQYQSALDNCDFVGNKADKTNDIELKIKAIYMKVLIMMALKQYPRAGQLAEEIKGICDKGFLPKHYRYYYHLLGQLAQIKGNVKEAEQYFLQAVSLLSHSYQLKDIEEHGLIFESLARLYDSQRDFNQAQQWYERITTLATVQLKWGDVYALSFYRLAKIFQQKGFIGKAIENYREFLNFWQNTNPTSKEVNDTQLQLKVLNSKN